jgi:chitodextrinase
VKKNLIILSLLISNFSFANYIYENNQPLFDLTTQSGVTSLNAGDDQVSAVFNLDFTFNFYGEGFTSARMATNGCLHFNSSGSYCNDYTPDPLPQYNNTLFPFWTDLIRDNNSKMLAKNFSDKAVFGWYDLREYNRSGSDNSFEVVLWTNSTFDYRYGELDINRHDVLIGEQKDASNYYQYLFYDECSTGTTNTGACVSVDWNNSIMNSTLESGGSLYGTGEGNSIDCSNPLNDPTCPGYWEAFDDQQCDLDPQYAPFCPGYRFEQDIGYFVMEEEFDYGFVDEQDLMAMGTFVEEPEIFFYEEEVFLQPIFREEEVYLDPLPDIYELPIELVVLTPFEQPFELTMRLEEEFFLEEIIELEEIEEYFEPEYEEEVEELVAELEEPEIEEVIEIEVEAVTVGKIDEKSGITQTQLDVVAQTVSAAANSVSGTTAGTEVHATSSNSFDMSISTNGGGMQNITELGSEAVVTTTVNVAVNNTEQAAVDNVQQVDKSEADTIADNIIAQNLEDQAEQVIEERATTDEYGDEANLIAYINYLPGFDMYTKTIMLDKTSWYESKVIYPVSLVDNTAAFTSLNGNSFNKLNKMINLQPNL